MKSECSYGIIPLQYKQRTWHVLLIQHRAGHWGFPKGHAMANETPKQAAQRELREETSLIVESFFLSEPFIETYVFQQIHKTVYYFLAMVQGKVSIQEDEIQDSRWLPILKAYELITFKE